MIKRYSVLIIVLILLFGVSGCQNDVNDNRDNQVVAQPIIIALNEYQQQNNDEYPQDLNDLVPDYLTALPKTIRGEEFQYYPDENEGYYLCFGIGTKGKYGCCYNQRLASWDCTNGD